MRTNPVFALALVPLLQALVACSAEPEQLSACTLTCSKPKVSAFEFVLEPMSAETELKLQCPVPANSGTDIVPLNGPLQVKYLLKEKTKNFTQLPPGDNQQEGPGGGAGGGGGGEGLAALGPGGGMGLAAGDPLYSEMPKAGIAFEPMLYGLMAVEKTAPEFKVNDTTVSPNKFAGVVTPSSEWCSDSCGVITYEFWPACRAGVEHEVTAMAVAGGVKAGVAYKFKLDGGQE